MVYIILHDWDDLEVLPMTLETPAYHDYHHSTMGRSHCRPLDPHDTLWLFNIYSYGKWPIYRWFSQLETSNYHGFSIAMLVITRWYPHNHRTPPAPAPVKISLAGPLRFLLPHQKLWWGTLQVAGLAPVTDGWIIRYSTVVQNVN